MPRPAVAKGRIYDALHRMGSGTNAEIQARIGYSHFTIAKALHALVVEGAVTVLPGDLPNQPWLYTTSDSWTDTTPVAESDTPDPIERRTILRNQSPPSFVAPCGLAGLVQQVSK